MYYLLSDTCTNTLHKVCVYMFLAQADLIRGKGRHFLPKYFWLFEVCGLHCIESYRYCCQLMSDFKAKNH